MALTVAVAASLHRVIEWSERIDWWPAPPTLTVTCAYVAENVRELVFVAGDARGAELLAVLEDDDPPPGRVDSPANHPGRSETP